MALSQFTKIFRNASGTVENMLYNPIADTTTTTTMENGRPKTILWKDLAGHTIRTDTFTWTPISLVEIRTLYTGESIKFTTDLTTNPPETTQSAITK
jgi:hypothetical protein